MNYSLYNKIVISILCIWLLPLFVLCFYMEPLNDELTRMGGYLENNYGWNAPQERFPKPLFTLAKSVTDYNEYYDIVVMGDSFSENQKNGWQNYLVNNTGLSLIAFNMTKIPMEHVLNSETYKENPPKLFIYQSVERNLLKRHDTCTNDEKSLTSSYTPPTIELKSLGLSTIPLTRNKQYYSVDGINLNDTVNFTKKALIRTLFDTNITEVHRFELSKQGLFSSRKDDSVLVITRDFMLKDATEQQVKTVQCSLLALQERIRNDNTTEFIALIIPDKTTVYSDLILDKSYTDMSIVAAIESTPNLNIAKLNNVFKESVKNGTVDFYLPNDTHCGYEAYNIAAVEVVKLLKSLTQTTQN